MKATILIADDINENRELVKHILKRSGYDILEATNGRETVDLALEHLPDLILMDAMMPVMSGFDASKLIRKTEPIQNIPILMITALNDMSNKIKALECGVNDFISKPFDRTEMMARINTTIMLHQKLLKKEKELLELNQSLEKKVAERTKALYIQERYNRAILDSESSLVFVIHQNRITDANLAFFRMFKDISLEGENIRQLKRHFVNCPEDGFFRAFEGNDWIKKLLESAEHDNKIRVRVGEKLYTFDIHVRSMLYHSGVDQYAFEHENRYIVTMSDITEFEELKEKRIRDAKMASIGKLAAGITHEINTPLAYMKGNLEMMQMEVEEVANTTLRSNLLETMDTLNEGVNRIATIVDTVREISKKTDIKREKTNLYQTLIYALRIIYNRSKQVSNIYVNGKLFTLDLSRDEEEYEVEIVKQRIEQVWIILLNNALDELAKTRSFDERRIDINIHEGQHRILVQVIDNAGGIQEDILEQIFDPFVSTKTHQGMGIGLNIARKIINEHQGKITADNLNGGACFQVYFNKPGYRPEQDET